MTIDEALAIYLLQLEADGRSLHTRRQYARHVALLVRVLGDVDVGAVTTADIARALVSPVITHGADGRAKQATTVNAIRSSLRTFFGWLHAAGMTASNPSRLIRRARCGSAPPRGLSEDEQRRLLDALAAGTDWQARRDYMLFELMLRTGIRLTSALALDVREVDLDRAELTLRRAKGDRVERVFLSERIRDRLAAFIDGRPAGPVFVSRHGGPLSSRQVQRRLAMWHERAGARKSGRSHAFRHAFAMALYRRTGDILLVATALHHRSVISSLAYARVDAERLRQALDLSA